MKKFTYPLLASLFFVLGACAPPDMKSFQDLASTQPYVTTLSPEPYQRLPQMNEINITLSQFIHPDSLNTENIYVVYGEVLKENIEDDSLSKVSASLSTEDFKTIHWQSDEELHPGDYSLVVSTQLQGNNHQPFNQKPGSDPEPFVAVFYVGDASSSSTGPSPSGNTGSPVNTTPLNPPAYLVLNEILYDAIGSDTDGNEFIELYGSPHADVDRYQVLLINGADGEIIDTINIPTGSKIGADGIFLIADARTNASKVSNIANSDFIDNFDPQNGPDAIQILDTEGRLVDSICYGSDSLPIARNGLETCEGTPAPDVSGGHSLSRINGNDTNDNSTDFVDLSAPTPGEM